jgi:hypothetical protein
VRERAEHIISHFANYIVRILLRGLERRPDGGDGGARVMSVTWISAIAVVVIAQKLLPERRAVDVGLALAVVALGVLVIASPGTVPELTPPMSTPMSMPTM